METKKRGITLIEALIVILLIAIGLVVSISINKKIRMRGEKNIHVMATLGTVEDSNIPGGITFQVSNYWGYSCISLIDYGFDGTLDRMTAGNNYQIDPNSPDWDIWVKRYLEIRAQATKGK
ncbi:MAG: hypothetical protein COU42_03075 [Candidatus Nealsonbacteria bacterium CG10_big_fil_rev_8_21_14_0_10_36_24]|uniref:Prepilin-type N-terminal cleavage/methylation domain-containing protein n=2 Tax=Candidatus Nealsoniibacteriota TaxID=1817911 RepID=A0A2H0YNA4_9BACT|nr:MAG: hypothetical protein COU42_03075 [Candidatus Nealsonbacteria bacterium CG10_big_fil_rev_8_21_14_0_10_36_24]PIS39981.1 MAG: hypothetical protein COT32_02195 [Candidatus Nealsonbacteria bacterium CG08_land_8_20_14_0_20_36_22]